MIDRPVQAFLEIDLKLEEEDFPPEYWKFIEKHFSGSGETNFLLPWPPTLIREAGQPIYIGVFPVEEVTVKEVLPMLLTHSINVHVHVVDAEGAEKPSATMEFEDFLGYAELGFLTENKLPISTLLITEGLPGTAEEYLKKHGEMYRRKREE